MTAPPFDCAQVDELAGLFVLDALTPEESTAVREHLARCDRIHDAFAELAPVTGALAASVEPVDAPADLRDRVLDAVAATAQIPDDVTMVGAPTVPVWSVASTAVVSSTVSPTDVTARQRGGPSRIAWLGLAAAAVIALAALGAWNVALQREISDGRARVALLEQDLLLARQDATDAGAHAASLETQIGDTREELAAAIRRADTSDAQLASLQTRITEMQVQVAAYEQQIATSDDRVALIGQAIGAATAPGSNVATLTSTPTGGSAAGMAIFPASGTGYIMVEGLPELAADQTYQAWYLAGGTPTSAGLMTAGPHGLAVVGGLEPVAGTDTIAVTVEPAGGVDQPTGTPIIVGTLPTSVALSDAAPLG